MCGPAGILIALLLPAGCLLAVLALGRLEDRLLNPAPPRRHRAVQRPKAQRLPAPRDALDSRSVGRTVR